MTSTRRKKSTRGGRTLNQPPAALVPDTDRDSGQSVPTVLMEPQSEDERPEVVLDGSGTA